MYISKPIFISYSRLDKNIVFPFVKRIEQELNTTCWIDYEGVEGGAQFEEVIVDAIDSSKVVLFMLSDNSLCSKWPKREVLYAEDEGKRVVPIIIDGKGLRRWFKFHFGNVDCIDLNEEEQCEKLLNNLSSWIGLERVSKKANKRALPANSSLSANPQFVISTDKTVITLSIDSDMVLTLTRDSESNRYVGKIPVQEILEMMKEKNRFKDIGVGTIIGACAGSILGPVGMVIGGTCGHLMEKFEGESASKEKIFNYVVSKLNKKYDLNLIRKNITGSDFIVELDANSVSGLM